MKSIVTSTYASWRAHRTIRLGAGIAYYGLFAIVPLLSISMALAGLVIQDADIEEALDAVLGDVVDGDATEFSESITATLDQNTILSGLGLIGVGFLLFAASLLFVALQDAFDLIWEAPARVGVRQSVRKRLMAFLVVLVTGAVLVAMFAVHAVSGLIRNLVPGNDDLLETAVDVVAVTGSWVLGGFVLALLFRFLALADLRWRIALVGGVTTALILAIGHRLVAVYLQEYAGSSLVGATGAVFVILVWIYAMAQIVLAGAELTRNLDLNPGPLLRPFAFLLDDGDPT